MFKDFSWWLSVAGRGRLKVCCQCEIGDIGEKERWAEIAVASIHLSNPLFVVTWKLSAEISAWSSNVLFPWPWILYEVWVLSISKVCLLMYDAHPGFSDWLIRLFSRFHTLTPSCHLHTVLELWNKLLLAIPMCSSLFCFWIQMNTSLPHIWDQTYILMLLSLFIWF